MLKVNCTGPRTPLDKYLKDPMPKVHIAHPAAFNFVETKKINEWDTHLTHKLLAILFGFEAQQQIKHNNIWAHILVAVVKIMQAEQVGVTIPGPEDCIITYCNETPITFLIHSLTKLQAHPYSKGDPGYLQRYLSKCSLSTPFQSSPDYLFTIDSLSTVGVQAAVQMILIKWGADSIHTMLTKIVQDANACSTHQIDLQAFYNSVTVQCLKVIQDKILVPRFNLYTNGELIQDHMIWTQIRDIPCGHSYDPVHDGLQGVVLNREFNLGCSLLISELSVVYGGSLSAGWGSVPWDDFLEAVDA